MVGPMIYIDPKPCPHSVCEAMPLESEWSHAIYPTVEPRHDSITPKSLSKKPASSRATTCPGYLAEL